MPNLYMHIAAPVIALRFVAWQAGRCSCAGEVGRRLRGTRDPIGYSVSIDFGSRRNGMMPIKVMPSLFIHGFS